MSEATTIKAPTYMKAYTRRVFVSMTAYIVILVAGLSLSRSVDLSEPLRIGLALLTALPICAVFWAIFRLLVECDDEYQRMLFVKQTLWATGATLVITTVWSFLKTYDVIASGPQWIAVIWFAMLGLAAPIVRWRA